MGIFGNGPQRQQFQMDDSGGGDMTAPEADARVTRTPYRGPRVRSRSSGQVYYWVGSEYVPENDLRRLTPQERTARQAAIDTAQQQQQLLPDLDRFLELNSTVPTGSLSQRMGNALGIPRLLSLDNPQTPQNEPSGYDEMGAIVNRLTPHQRQGLPGAASDTDVRMFRGGLPGIQNTGPTNYNIIQGLRREAADNQAYAEFLDWYWPRNGSLAGAQEQFQRYRAARAAREASDARLPADRREGPLTWRQFFDRQQRQTPTPRQGSQGQTLRYDPATGEFH